MAPRKNEELTAKTTRKRVNKSKVEKPKLKTPTVIKIKIPAKPLSPPGPYDEIIKNCRKINEQQQFALTNEVALAQLSKPSDVNQFLIEPEAPPAVKGNKKKSTVQHKGVPSKRKKKDETINGDGIDNNAIQEEISGITSHTQVAVRKVPAKKKTSQKKAKSTDPTASIVKKSTSRPKITRPKANITSTSLTNTAEQNSIEIQAETNTPKNVVTTQPETKAPLYNVKRSSRKIKIPIRYGETEKTSTKSVLNNVSRKSSASSDRLSWTQDITSSSTTTCVTVQSNDFYRFDNKLPIVKVEPIQHVQKKSEPRESLSSSSSSCSSSSTSSSDSEDELSENKLNLSTSSASLVTNVQTKGKLKQVNTSFGNLSLGGIPHEPGSQNRPVDLNSLEALLDEGVTQFNEFETFLNERLGEIQPQSTLESVSDVLELESEIILLSRELTKCLSETEDSFARPAAPARRSVSERREDIPLQRSRSISVDHENYDDDALSLFAESISTAIETRPSLPHEEYVPTPLVPSPMSRNYEPTRIESSTSRPVCEVQTADSTSVQARNNYENSYSNPPINTHQMDSTIQSSAKKITENCNKISLRFSNIDKDNLGSDPASINFSKNTPGLSSEPVLNFVRNTQEMDSSFSNVDRDRVEIGVGNLNFIQPNVIQERSSTSEPGAAVPARPVLATKSVQQFMPLSHSNSALFRGICFHYVASLTGCRFVPCRFEHIVLEDWIQHFQQRFIDLKDAIVLREMKLVWNYERLKQTLAPLFVLELARRGLTRAMMEALTVAAIGKEATPMLEVALLHLNQIDFKEISDILTRPLCDAMLITLANTQNFSRFRAVFSKLADFIADNNQPIALDVATKILERVYILPCDETLARAMVRIIRQTDRKIFQLDMIGSLENYLELLGGMLKEEFVELKRQAQNPETSPPEVEEDEETRKRYTSPDTTHFDNMNTKTRISSMITRTVDLERATADTTIVTFKNTLPPHQPYNSWRQPYHRPPRPELRPGRPNGWQPAMRHNMPFGNRTIRTRPVYPNFNYNHMPGDYYNNLR